VRRFPVVVAVAAIILSACGGSPEPETAEVSLGPTAAASEPRSFAGESRVWDEEYNSQCITIWFPWGPWSPCGVHTRTYSNFAAQAEERPATLMVDSASLAAVMARSPSGDLADNWQDYEPWWDRPFIVVEVFDWELGSSRDFSQAIERVASEYADQAGFVRIDGVAHADYVAQLTGYESVAIPTTLVISEGNVLARATGLPPNDPAAALRGFLQPYLGDLATARGFGKTSAPDLYDPQDESNAMRVVSGPVLPASIDRGDVIVALLGAPWCGPCRLLDTDVERMAMSAKTMSPAVTYASVDVNTPENADLAMRYGVRGVPTVLVFAKGRLLGSHVGYVKDIDRVVASLMAKG